MYFLFVCGSVCLNVIKCGVNSIWKTNKNFKMGLLYYSIQPVYVLNFLEFDSLLCLKITKVWKKKIIFVHAFFCLCICLDSDIWYNLRTESRSKFILDPKWSYFHYKEPIVIARASFLSFSSCFDRVVS